MKPKPDPQFLIIETGQPVASLRRHGRFPHWIRVAAGLRADQATFVNVEAGEHLPDQDSPDHDRFTGVVITGSSAMVTDRHAWSERSADWLRGAVKAEMPILGICYGHQLLAHALGGEVDYNPSGREMGTVSVDVHPQADDDPLFAPLPARFAVQVSHLQSVLRPPAGATVLARSDQDDCQAFRWRHHVWGLQFHPEFSVDHMRGYVHARRDALQLEGHCHQHLARSVKPTPHARGVLRRFTRHAATLRGH